MSSDVHDAGFATWAELNRCDECGRIPTRSAYEDHLRWEIERLERVLAMTPEEREKYEAEQAHGREMARALMAPLFRELRPGLKWMHSFKGMAEEAE